MRALAIVHCFHPELWPELEAGLTSVRAQYELDVHLTVPSGSPLTPTGVTRWEVPNQGLDIGPFLRVCSALGEKLYSYPYLLKLHGKKSSQTHPRHHPDGSVWRRDLIHPLCYRASECFNALSDPGVGTVARASWVSQGDWINAPQVQRYRLLGGVFPAGNTPQHWVAGTMFWCKPGIFRPFFHRLDPLFLAGELEPGYFTDWHEGRNTHALERVFGYLNAARGLRVVGV